MWWDPLQWTAPCHGVIQQAWTPLRGRAREPHAPHVKHTTQQEIRVH